MEKCWLGYRMVKPKDGFGGWQQEQVVSDSKAKVCQWMVSTIRNSIAHEKLFAKSMPEKKPVPYAELEQFIQREDWDGVHAWLEYYKFRHGIPAGLYQVGKLP